MMRPSQQSGQRPQHPQQPDKGGTLVVASERLLERIDHLLVTEVAAQATHVRW
jgi:hypothetical protein